MSRGGNAVLLLQQARGSTRQAEWQRGTQPSGLRRTFLAGATLHISLSAMPAFSASSASRGASASALSKVATPSHRSPWLTWQEARRERRGREPGVQANAACGGANQATRVG